VRQWFWLSILSIFLFIQPAYAEVTGIAFIEYQPSSQTLILKGSRPFTASMMTIKENRHSIELLLEQTLLYQPLSKIAVEENPVVRAIQIKRKMKQNLPQVWIRIITSESAPPLDPRIISNPLKNEIQLQLQPLPHTPIEKAARLTPWPSRIALQADDIETTLNPIIPAENTRLTLIESSDEPLQKKSSPAHIVGQDIFWLDDKTLILEGFPAPRNVLFLEKPSRICLTFSATQLALKPRVFAKANDRIQHIRTRQVDATQAMVILDMAQPLTPSTQPTWQYQNQHLQFLF
jgi:hypothetical protein